MKKLLLIAPLLFLSTSLFAQWQIGASYELRDKDPQNGFGLRLEKEILSQLPVIKLGLRAHASYFSAENSISTSGITYSEDLTTYDFGVAITGGLSVGLVEPYVGLGLGSETLDIDQEDIQGVNANGDANESNIYWNGVLGAKVALMPILKPFVEFRYSDNSLSKPDRAEVTAGRMMFGIVLQF